MRRWWQNLLSGGICCSLNGMEEGLLGSTERFDSDLQYLTSRPSSYLNGIAPCGCQALPRLVRQTCSDTPRGCQALPRLVRQTCSDPPRGCQAPPQNSTWADY